MWQRLKPQPGNLRVWQFGLLVALLAFWHVMTAPGLLPNFMFENDRQAAFFFGQPAVVAQRIWAWFVTDADIYRHLAVTLTETMLAFAIGSVLGLGAARALHQGHELDAAHHPGADLRGVVRAGHRQ